MSPELFALIFVLVVFAGVFIVFMGLRQRSQQMELQHRERMAMIERGQIPTAEPAGWHRPGHRAARGGSASRALSVGIVVVGLGLALMTVIGVAGGAPEIGIGVGGALAILGAAFIVRSLVVRPESAGWGEPSPRVEPVEPPRSDAP